MIREVTIRLQKLTAFHPSAQFLQHIRIETTPAISSVHHDMETQKRLLHLRVNAGDNQFFQMFLIGRQERRMQHFSGAFVRFCGFQMLCDFQHFIQLTGSPSLPPS